LLLFSFTTQILQDGTENDVIEVFRKGTADMFNLPNDQKLESEKQLIKLLLEDNKRRRELKKKEVIAEETVQQHTKKSNMVGDAANDKTKKEKLSDDSMEALIKLLTDRTTAKKQVNENAMDTKQTKMVDQTVIATTKKESVENSIKSFEALNKLLNGKESAESKKEVDPKDASLKALAELLQKKDQAKKEVKGI